jgi:hypothetical protein
MVKRYSIQILGTIPTHLDSLKWLEQYKVQLIGTSLSENILLIQCEESDLANFLKNLNFAKLK